MRKLIPQFILENYNAKIYRGNLPSVGMLIDASGFSKLTDTLAKHGQHGSEVLASVMRSIFDPMVDSVHAHGGIVVGFSGDAITAVFPDNENFLQAARYAISTAFQIRQQLEQHGNVHTPYGNFTIAFKIGLGHGTALWRIIQSVDQRNATFYFRGTAIDQAVRAEMLAKPGEIYIDAALQKQLKDQVQGQFEKNYYLTHEFTGKLESLSIAVPPQPDPDLLKVFCTDAILAQTSNGEFRPAVNLFINIPLEKEAENQAEPIIQKAITLLEKYGGLLTHPEYGDKGLNLLLFWGAPIAQENDVERALAFALAFLQETGIAFKIGVTYRVGFAGFMGGNQREEYTCYGWGVSLAARIMMSSQAGEVWVDEEIFRRAEKKFNFQFIGKQSFKGFKEEQGIYKLLNRKEDSEAVFTGKFFGREAEQETLSKFMGPIWNEQFAGMLTVLGEPGIGKSRLVYQFHTSETFLNRAVLWATCQTDEIVRQSLNPFRYWLRRYFGVFETQAEEDNKRNFDHKLNELIASTPDEDLSAILERTRSFLGELVNLHWTGSLYEQVDAQGRYENTVIALSAFLRAEGRRQPVVILIEDAHLLDNDTKSFLSYLARTILANPAKQYPIAILTTARPDGIDVLLEDAPNEIINLGELRENDLAQLAETMLGSPASQSLLKLIEQRAEGNPFFAEQIIRYLQEEDNLEETGKGWAVAGEQPAEALPTDVSAVLIARLDRLTRDVKETVQTASVLGREFDVRLLSSMLHGDEMLSDKIRYAVSENILATISEIRYIFKHALVRDAAYNMQLRAHQQELHNLAMEAFETLYQDDLSPHYFEIAYHAEHATFVEKALRYYRLSGESAAQAYQNSLAAESFTRALALSTIQNIQERFELLYARETAYDKLGQRDAQEQDLATLELLAERQKNTRNQALAAYKQSVFAFSTSDFHESEILAKQAIDFAQKGNHNDVITWMHQTLPLVLARQGKIEEAIQAAQEGITISQDIGDKDGEGQILNSLGLIVMDKNEIAQSRSYFEQSLAIAREVKAKRLEAQVLNNIGMINGMVDGNYANARDRFSETLEIVREIGDRKGEAYALGNLGWVSAMRGDSSLARKYQEQALAVAREIGNKYSEAYSLINLSALAVSQEDFSAAMTYALQGLTLTKKIEDRSAEAWSLTYLGHAYLGLTDFEQASEAYQEAISIRQALNQPSLETEPLAGLAQVEIESGDLDAALIPTERIASHLENGGTLEGAEEPIRVYLSMYRVFNARNDLRADQILEKAYTLLTSQVSAFQNEETKKMYVQNVPWRREVVAAWKKRQQETDK